MTKGLVAMVLVANLMIVPLRANAQDPVAGENGLEGDKQAQSAQVIEPDIERRNIKVPHIKSEDIEFGVYYGVYSAEDFGSAQLTGVRLAYHVTEDIFFEGAYGTSTVTDAQYRPFLPSGIFINEVEKLTYYSVSVGYNFFPGEVFVSKQRAMSSAVYVIAGIGNTNFAQEDRATINFGLGIRVLPTDWLAVHFDMRDNIFRSDILGVSKTANNFEMHAGLTVFF